MLSPKKIVFIFVNWLLVTNILVGVAQLTDAWLVKTLLFLSLTFLPGAALLRALRITRPSLFLEGILYSFGLGLLVLMVSGLAANQMLHLLGVARPLELHWILGAWNIATLACIVVAARTNHQALKVKRVRWSKLSKTTWVVGLASLFLPLLAAFGAFRLNNGGVKPQNTFHLSHCS